MGGDHGRRHADGEGGKQVILFICRPPFRRRRARPGKLVALRVDDVELVTWDTLALVGVITTFSDVASAMTKRSGPEATGMTAPVGSL